MTVGISLTNGLEAIVITDSRVSSQAGRQSDCVNKTRFFNNRYYKGVIFGTGSSVFVLGLLNYINELTSSHNNKNNLDNLVNSLQERYKATINREDCLYLQNHKDEILKKASTISDEGERINYIKKEIAELMQRYIDMKEEPNHITNTTYFILVAYDKKMNKIRQFHITSKYSIELPLEHIEIGAGADGANMYFFSKLQGIDVSELALGDLGFFAANAYSLSTINTGVGGTPKIAVISQGDVKILSPNRTTAIVNLSGAYLASEGSVSLSQKIVREYINGIINGKPQYNKIATAIGIEQSTLKNIYIPYSSWVERTNKFLFSH